MQNKDNRLAWPVDQGQNDVKYHMYRIFVCSIFYGPLILKIFHTCVCFNETRMVLLLWIIYVISVLFLLYFLVHLFIDALWSPAGKGLTSWLSFVMSNCEVVTFPLVSWVRCDA